MPHPYDAGYIAACNECARAIRALPTTFTDDELLAAAMQLPDVRALVDELRQIVIENTIQQGGGMSDPHGGPCARIARAALAPFMKGAS